MLSRVADALYWLGRYLERAENVTRLLVVTSDLAAEVEGLDETLAKLEWDELLGTLSDAQSPEPESAPGGDLAVSCMRQLLFGPDNLMSVRHSLACSRDNARAIREALTREVFLNLNECYLDLEAQRRRGIRDRARGLEVATTTHRAILTILGAIEHTLSRDEGWTFLKLGEAMERTLRTLMVLRAKLPSLAARPSEVDLPLHYARWRSVLRSVASLENFRATHGARLEPERVIRFLLFDPSSPRSVHCGAVRMQGYLARLAPGGQLNSGRRILGRLVARITYEDDRILAQPQEVCEELARELVQAHDAIARQFFPA